MFADKSPVEAGQLKPAEMLPWNISPQTAADIQTATHNLNKSECKHTNWLHVHVQCYTYNVSCIYTCTYMYVMRKVRIRAIREFCNIYIPYY